MQKGLSSEKAAEILKTAGPNLLSSQKKESGFVIFVSQFKDLLTLILLAAAVISFFMGEIIDSQENNTKLVIGHFRQIENPMYVDVQASADRLQLVVGVETIYCVKDGSIISNIRGAKV